MVPVLLALLVSCNTSSHFQLESPDAVDFLKKVPVVWEDTKFLSGYPGKDVVIARKSGNRWYIAGINGENIEKEITIDLSQLGTIPEYIEMIVDGNGAQDMQSTVLASVDGHNSREPTSHNDNISA